MIFASVNLAPKKLKPNLYLYSVHTWPSPQAQATYGILGAADTDPSASETKGWPDDTAPIGTDTIGAPTTAAQVPREMRWEHNRIEVMPLDWSKQASSITIV
jgi:hypothetical protein